MRLRPAPVQADPATKPHTCTSADLALVMVSRRGLACPRDRLLRVAARQLSVDGGGMRRVYRYWATEGAPRRARKAVRNAVLAWECGDDVAEVAELLTSEIATNAVVHAPASSEFIVEIGVAGGHLTVGVTDFGGGRPQATRAGTEDEHGRGLAMVRDLSESWGIEAVGGQAKRVFFQLSVKPVPERVREREALGAGVDAPREAGGGEGTPRSAPTFGFRLRPPRLRLRLTW
ncbi:ATP-binding protein [Streptomyces sp. 6N223]|uniref:ATP-binding protein n=1 Tax=Streptomyces sp. 6N223 TaxID=3457412 RepID=UPI003FCF9876